MIIDESGYVRTQKGVVEVRPFLSLDPVEVMLHYMSNEPLTEAEMKADIEPVKDQVLSKIREHIEAEDNVLDRLMFINHHITYYTPRDKRNLVGQYAGRASELLFIK